MVRDRPVVHRRLGGGALRCISLWILLSLLIPAVLTTGCERPRQAPPPRPAPSSSPIVQRTLVSDEDNNIAIFKSASPATVFITNNQLRRDLLTLNVFEIPQGSGSGFIWNRDGYIVTNSHVVAGASSVSVGLGADKTYKAKLVGVAHSLDIALLKISAPSALLNPLPLGNSGKLQVGQKVLAIGNPFGLDFTLTTGIISALGREIAAPDGRRIRGVIQTDAAINPGNSGGPLMDSAGRVIGINTAIIGPGGGSAGIGFAVPINSVAKVVPQLIQYGRVIRPILGVSLVRDGIAREMGISGAIIMNTLRGKAAHKAGLMGVERAADGRLMLGDVIVKLDRYRIEDTDDLLNALEQYAPGDTVTILTQRRGTEKTFRVTLSQPE